MYWQFTLENTSNVPYTFIIDKNSVKGRDSTGKTYTGTMWACGGTGGSNLDKTINPKDSLSAEMGVDVKDVGDISYMELQFTLNAKPLIFRYPLNKP